MKVLAMWKQIGICPGWQCDDRLWHAGLSDDGSKCFVAGFDDNVYIVWDIDSHSVIWRDDGSAGDSDLEALDKWMDAEGYVAIAAGPAMGRYRIFGLNFGRPRSESDFLNQRLEVNAPDGTVVVRDRDSDSIVCELAFDAFSGDWAFASFSDNDRTIAVIEPYSVTFFGRSEVSL